MKILEWPHEALSRSCEPVTDFGPFTFERFQRLTKTFKRSKGIGLAAPQVGWNARAFVTIGRNAKGSLRTLWIANPVIEIVEDSPVVIDYEACLSAPEVRLMVRRPDKVVLSGIDARSVRPFKMALEGLNARVAQHEVDHLDGVMFWERADPDRTFEGWLLAEEKYGIDREDYRNRQG